MPHRIYADLTSLGFPNYCVGSDGSLWSKRHRNGQPSLLWRNMSVKPCLRNKGYRVATLVDANKTRRMFPMRCLMLLTFVGKKPSPRHQACHNNGIHNDDRIDNLRWGTPESNWEDRIKHGKDNRGEKSGKNKYPERLIRRLKKALNKGMRPYLAVKMFGIPKSTVNSIKRGLIWKWVK